MPITIGHQPRLEVGSTPRAVSGLTLNLIEPQIMLWGYWQVRATSSAIRAQEFNAPTRSKSYDLFDFIPQPFCRRSLQAQIFQDELDCTGRTLPSFRTLLALRTLQDHILCYVLTPSDAAFWDSASQYRSRCSAGTRYNSTASAITALNPFVPHLQLSAHVAYNQI